jgi:hypothetical protein
MFGLFMGVIDIFLNITNVNWFGERKITFHVIDSKNICLWNEVVKNNSDTLNLNSLDVWLHICAFSFFLLYFFLPMNKGQRN